MNDECLPAFGLLLTVLAYAGAWSLSAKLHHVSWCNPVFISIVIAAFVLLIAEVPYEAYWSSGAKWLHYGLGPATVALAIPLRSQFFRIAALRGQLLSTVSIGSLAGMISGAFIAWGMGAHVDVISALAARSATAPIAIALVHGAGGSVSLAAIFAIGTGLMGALLGVQVCRCAGLHDDAGIGFVLGVSAHGIGTARAYQISYEAGAFAGLGMLLNGVLTAVLYHFLFSGLA